MASDTTIKGELACLHLEKRAYEKGAIVSRPTIECGYDRLIDYKGKIYRVQVKYAGGSASHAEGVATTNLRRSDRNKSQTYTKKEIDAVVCYLPDADLLCWLPPDVWEGKSALSIRYKLPKNGQKKGCLMAESYIW